MRLAALAMGLLASAGRALSAQSTSSGPPTSTLIGVYTAEQAARGKNGYLGLCRSCHNPSTGDAFAKRWAGKMVSDLFAYIFETMPQNDPRTLSPTDNADIVSYLLQVTAMPPGGKELPTDPDSLKIIRIEIKRDSSLHRHRLDEEPRLFFMRTSAPMTMRGPASQERDEAADKHRFCAVALEEGLGA